MLSGAPARASRSIAALSQAPVLLLLLLLLLLLMLLLLLLPACTSMPQPAFCALSGRGSAALPPSPFSSGGGGSGRRRAAPPLLEGCCVRAVAAGGDEAGRAFARIRRRCATWSALRAWRLAHCDGMLGDERSCACSFCRCGCRVR